MRWGLGNELKSILPLRKQRAWLESLHQAANLYSHRSFRISIQWPTHLQSVQCILAWSCIGHSLHPSIPDHFPFWSFISLSKFVLESVSKSLICAKDPRYSVFTIRPIVLVMMLMDHCCMYLKISLWTTYGSSPPSDPVLIGSLPSR